MPTAGGVAFINLKDEVGMISVICPTKIWEEQIRRDRQVGSGAAARGCDRDPEGSADLKPARSCGSCTWPRPWTRRPDAVGFELTAKECCEIAGVHDRAFIGRGSVGWIAVRGVAVGSRIIRLVRTFVCAVCGTSKSIRCGLSEQIVERLGHRLREAG